MAYFPMFIELKNKKCIIFGGGIVAFRKIEALFEFEADITVVSPVFCDEIKHLENKLHLIYRTYHEEDVETAFLVIAATDDTEVNSRISEACQRRRIPVNVVDELDQCSFLFPAYMKQGPISIGVTTSGKSPVIAGHVKRYIQKNLPKDYADLADTLGGFRGYVKQKVSSVPKRASIFKELAGIGFENGGRVTQEDVDALIKKHELKQ